MIALSRNDPYAVICRFDVDVEDVAGDVTDGSIPCPGEFLVKWRRWVSVSCCSHVNLNLSFGLLGKGRRHGRLPV